MAAPIPGPKAGFKLAFGSFFMLSQSLPQTLRRIWPSTVLSGATVVASFLLPLPRNGKILGVPSPCGFQHLFHIPCPGCGLTRAFVAMAHGHVGEAFVWHPMGPLLWTLAFGYTLWSLWVTFNRPPFRVSQSLQLGAYGVITVLMFVTWALRLAGYFPLALT